MTESCNTCRYRLRSVLKQPCATGSYQLRYSKRCFGYKPMRWWQKLIVRYKGA